MDEKKNTILFIALFVILFMGWLAAHNKSESEHYRSLYEGQRELVEEIRKKSREIQDSLIFAADSLQRIATKYDSLETHLKKIYEEIPSNVSRIPRSKLDELWNELGY